MPFLDIYLPDEIPGYPCVSAPRTKTTITMDSGGSEQRNQDWERPLYRFVLPEGARKWAAVDGLSNMWKITRGPYYSFAWRDPLDKASCDLLAPNELDVDVLARITATDQYIGAGDGFTDTFPLVKTYSYGSETYDRPIYLPVLDSVKVAVDGVLVSASDYSVSRPGGLITFDTPPDDGLAISAGFMFDIEVRFESDDAFEGILRTWQLGGFADLTLVEVRPC